MPNTDLATIVVKLDGGEKKSPIASGGGGDKEVSTGFQGAANLVNASKKLFAVGTPLYFAKTIAKNRIGTVNLQTGALEYEQKLQFATQTVETVLSTAGSAILAGAAAQLAAVELRAPASVIGKSTREAVQAGVVMGEVARIDGLIDMVWRELGCKTLVVATGAGAQTMRALSARIDAADEHLTLRGLGALHALNRR